MDVKKSSALPDIMGFNDQGSGSSSMMYVLIIVIVLLIVVAIAIILIVAARRKRGKKAAPAPAPPQPGIHSNKPEYSQTQATVQNGKQERTPVYAVSKPAPARSKPAPARSVPKPPMRAMPAPPPPPPVWDEEEEFEIGESARRTQGAQGRHPVGRRLRAG